MYVYPSPKLTPWSPRKINPLVTTMCAPQMAVTGFDLSSMVVMLDYIILNWKSSRSGFAEKLISVLFSFFSSGSGRVYIMPYTCMCLYSAPILPGGEVWEADMEKTGGGCGGPRGGQQPCSGTGNSSRTPGCVYVCSHILGK